MQGSSETKKITHGFLLSLAAGVLVLINGIVWFMLIQITGLIYDEMMLPTYYSLPFIILGSVAILFAIAIFIGTLFIYMYTNKQPVEKSY